MLAAEARRYPALRHIGEKLGGVCRIRSVPIPLLCRDGFNEAYYGRPEMLLDAAARLSCSAWSFVSPDVSEAYVEHLRDALGDGRWDRKHGQLRTQSAFDGSLRLIVSHPADAGFRVV